MMSGYRHALRQGETNFRNLDDLRQHLKMIDDCMLQLLSLRAGVILDVAAFKQQHEMPVHVPEREAAIFARLREENPGPLSDDAIEPIYRVIVDEMRKFESEQTTHDG